MRVPKVCFSCSATTKICMDGMTMRIAFNLESTDSNAESEISIEEEVTNANAYAVADHGMDPSHFVVDFHV